MKSKISLYKPIKTETVHEMRPHGICKWRCVKDTKSQRFNSGWCYCWIFFTSPEPLPYRNETKYPNLNIQCLPGNNDLQVLFE